jgi:hypothetical protein
LVALNHFTVPRAIVDRPSDIGNIIVIGGLANAAIELCTSGFAKAWFRRTGAG